MKQYRKTIIGTVVIFLLGACSSNLSSSLVHASHLPVSATPSPTLTTTVPAHPCGPKMLTLGHGPFVVPMTGEHSDLYTLTNRSSTKCRIAGYPTLTFYDANGKKLPFRFVYGRGPYVTSAPPQTVPLAPGSSAYFLAAKYRCDTGILQNAASIRVSLPRPYALRLAGRASSLHLGAATLSYCLGGAANPGNTIYVSPVERSPNATTKA
jgi:hypothetical protein